MKQPLKYSCLNRYNEILNNCENNDLKQLLIQMFDLVKYQMKEIENQRIEIIGLKYKKMVIL